MSKYEVKVSTKNKVHIFFRLFFKVIYISLQLMHTRARITSAACIIYVYTVWAITAVQHLLLTTPARIVSDLQTCYELSKMYKQITILKLS